MPGERFFLFKVRLMRDIMFMCPNCKSASWRSRYLFWKHLHKCLKTNFSNKQNAEQIAVNQEMLQIA
jgi:hypothetical protein